MALVTLPRSRDVIGSEHQSFPISAPEAPGSTSREGRMDSTLLEELAYSTVCSAPH